MALPNPVEQHIPPILCASLALLTPEMRQVSLTWFGEHPEETQTLKDGITGKCDPATVTRMLEKFLSPEVDEERVTKILTAYSIGEKLDHVHRVRQQLAEESN